MNSTTASVPRPASSVTLLSFDSTLGAIVIAEILVAVLYGITSMQVYVYFHSGRSPHDSRLIKRTIFSLWILSSLYIVLASHAVYYYTVTNFMNPSIVTKQPPTWCWSLLADMFIGDLIEVAVSMYVVLEARSDLG
ncbi:uncharacterized protein PHACADRAFT_210812 [Phanerochaete carnosa HHB-10118-sp]|uniref:Uncharacterized protein n=1 Tax=Phanerochaete carnosa (strain HHB-10118-sp) TaxID=650164 RepID=K5W1T9_PHACS|nr:uncharacterized protein PHACADRAFT_210812 [Phanerochaete carnosa HHB-10118-sp]EKM53095.1 hypothetical protein PHACADRAFT_210812 [Phanerochaete carnosa HHB-10118-sp]